MKTEFTDIEIRDYLRCPKWYRWFYIEGIRRPRPVLMVEAQVFAASFHKALTEGYDIDQHREYWNYLYDKTEPSIGLKVIGTGTRKRMPREARECLDKVLGVFYFMILPNMSSPPPWEDCEPRQMTYAGYTVTFKPDMLMGTSLVYIQSGPIVDKYIEKTEYIELLIPFIENVKTKLYVLSMNPASKKQLGRFSEYSRKSGVIKASNIVRDTCNAINAEHYPRTAPQNRFCSKRTCEFYDMCTKYLER